MNRPFAIPWAVTPRPNPGARLRLFCFPYAGGGATLFSGWPRALPDQVEVVAVQPPGRESRIAEAPIARMDVLIPAMAAGLLPLLRERPFAFFGYSNGALMAFELARHLRRTGGPLPLHLLAAARPAPHLEPDDPPIHHLPHDEFVAELRKLNGTPEEVLEHRELLELLLPLLRADFALGETYRHTPEPPLPIPLSAYGGERDEDVPPEQVQAWAEHTDAAFRVRFFPGGHFFIHEDRHQLLSEVAAELRAHLASRAHGG